MNEIIIAESKISHEKGNGTYRLNGRVHKSLSDIIDCDALQIAKNETRARPQADILVA